MSEILKLNNKNPMLDLFQKYFIEAFCGGGAATAGVVYNISARTDIFANHSAIHFFKLSSFLYLQTFALHFFEAIFFGIVGAAAGVLGKYLALCLGYRLKIIGKKIIIIMAAKLNKYMLHAKTKRKIKK
jgi:hypothetical protein